MKIRYFLILPFFLSLLFFTDAKVQAISEFDNTYKTTDILLLKADYYGVNEDVTINWQQLFLNPEGITSEIYPYQFKFNNSLATTEQIADMRDSWVNRKENWSVSQEWTNSEKTMGNIIVSWSESKNQSLDWISADHTYKYPSQVRVTNNTYEIEITQNVGNYPNNQYYQVNIYTNRTSTVISNGNEYPYSIRENFLSYVNNPIYPPDYEGIQIREFVGPKTVIAPEFDYTINNKQISLKHRKDLDKLPPDTWTEFTQDGYQLKGDSYNISWTITTTINNQTELIHNSQIPSGQELTIELPEYAEYDISAYYVAESCYYYEGEATPPYCFIAYPTDTSEFDYQSKNLKILVDGYYKEGSTTELNCLFGFCETPDTNCSLMDDFVDKTVCEMNKQLNFGVINPSITAFRKLFTAFVVPPNPSCSLQIPNATINGQTIQSSQIVANACNQAQNLRSTFTIIPILVNFVFALLILQVVVAIINRLTDNSKHDLIEGV